MQTHNTPIPESDSIIGAVLDELAKATIKFPTWPTDPIHAQAVLDEEVGELKKEVLQLTYEPHKSSRDKVRKEAIQTAAMALRFLLSLDRYEFTRGPQHSQGLRFLSIDECKEFGEPGSQNEVAVHTADGDRVLCALIFTQHASGWREPRTIPYGHPTYVKLVAAADARKQAA